MIEVQKSAGSHQVRACAQTEYSNTPAKCTMGPLSCFKDLTRFKEPFRVSCEGKSHMFIIQLVLVHPHPVRGLAQCLQYPVKVHMKVHSFPLVSGKSLFEQYLT